MPVDESVPGVLEAASFAPVPSAGGAASRPLLIEVPHGATTAAHFDSLRGRLRGDYPEDLREFYFVNTDVGAPETAREIARLVSGGEAGAPPAAVRLLRCLIPRTFIDVNRILDAGAPDYQKTGITPGLPDWVVDPSDRELLRSLYDRYQQVARAEFDAVCGAGGIALTLHTYAPRSVEIDRIDLGVAQALRRAYEPALYDGWPLRPSVEIIDRTPDDERLSSATLADAVEAAFAGIGIPVERNVTYRLDPKTSGHAHSMRHRGSVLCVEINRALLADPFDPFVEMRISREKAARMAAPLARALAAGLSAGAA